MYKITLTQLCEYRCLKLYVMAIMKGMRFGKRKTKLKRTQCNYVNINIKDNIS